jgi:hypothetical protein
MSNKDVSPILRLVDVQFTFKQRRPSLRSPVFPVEIRISLHMLIQPLRSICSLCSYRR